MCEERLGDQRYAPSFIKPDPNQENLVILDLTCYGVDKCLLILMVEPENRLSST